VAELPFLPMAHTAVGCSSSPLLTHLPSYTETSAKPQGRAGLHATSTIAKGSAASWQICQDIVFLPVRAAHIQRSTCVRS